MQNRKLLRLRSLLLFVAAVAGGAWAQAPTAVVEVARASIEAIAPSVRAPGTVVSTLDAMVSSEIDGRLIMVAEVGQRLDEGEPIGIIDDHVWQLQKQANQATIRRLQASLDYLERQQQRLSSLASKNNTAEAELDELRSQREMIAQELQAAQVQLARTQYDISRARVVAPFAGIVVERRQMPGEYTTVGKELARLVNTDSLEVSARAPIVVTRFNKAGDLVEISSDYQSATLPIRSLVPVGDTRSRQVEVRLAVAGNDWVIGEAVRVALANGPGHQSVTVPRDALVLRNGSVHVFRVDADSVAHKVAVATGDGQGPLVAINGEINADDRIVVLGAESLRDGQSVEVVGETVVQR